MASDGYRVAVPSEPVRTTWTSAYTALEVEEIEINLQKFLSLSAKENYSSTMKIVIVGAGPSA